MTFLEHIGELRKRIVFSMAAVLICFVGFWPFVDKLYHFLSLPVLKYLPEGQKLAYTSLTEPFMMYIKLSFIASLFAASPVVFWQLWKFISPGLYPKEKKMVFPFVIGTTFFFFLGGAFAYFGVFPWACQFFLDVGKDFQAILTINDYFSLAFRVIMGVALVFELPVLIFLLARLRIVTASFLIKHIKYAIVLIFIIAAIITPTPDMVTQSLFAGPMLLLYLLSILIARFAYPKTKD
jgi:sec-independent protein translocase protein TatC